MMRIKNMLYAVAIITIVQCTSKDAANTFTLTGDIKNAPDQDVYLEELFFSNKNPQVVDTAAMKAGHFEVKTVAPQEGMYRIRLADGKTGFIFVNDKSSITFTADLNNMGLEAPTFNSPANLSLKGFMLSLDEQNKKIMKERHSFDSLIGIKNNDSLANSAKARAEEMLLTRKAYIFKYIDTVSSPTLALFALGADRNIPLPELEKPVMGLQKRFPKNETVATIVTQYNEALARLKNPPPPPPTEQQDGPAVGSTAPDITMPDTEGKSFSLSSLKGKYVLVDFWASWCGPCRGENPNVVAAYNKFKDKNFTILGVSLDKEKAAWLQAIQEDGLPWKQVSDLKFWGSAATQLYGITSIPYNVLVDPQGKIIAAGLRGGALEQKLSEVLQ